MWDMSLGFSLFISIHTLWLWQGCDVAEVTKLVSGKVGAKAPQSGAFSHSIQGTCP